jgi:putative Mg2+ transporter-C (MgtC) family protein
MACGAGLPALALFVTGVHFLVVYGYTPVARRILFERAELEVQYSPGQGAVEKIMKMCTGRGFSIQEFAVRQDAAEGGVETRAMHLQLRGRQGVAPLIAAIGDIKGVRFVRIMPSQ